MIAGRMLADPGADVIQVEPLGGSTARACAPLDASGASLFFDAYAANKRGVAADPDTAAGQSLIRRLAAAADILIESADPGLMAPRSLDWADLRKVNPRLVYVSVTPFERTGQKAHYAESDLTVWAAGGPLNPHRDGIRRPVRVSLPQSYRQAGADAAAGALLALQARELTGRGQHVDMSAQASLGIATLAQVLAHAAGDRQPGWEKTVSPRVDQSGSGANTAPSQKKWPGLDGTVEFHLGVGPAVGGFTGALVRWMVDEGAAPAELLDIDWRTLPQRIKDRTFTGEDMAKVRDAVAAFLAAKTKPSWEKS